MDEHPRPDDEIDLLDLLVTVAENIKLLILGPLLAGVLAFGVVSVLPATYESGFKLQGQKKVGPTDKPIELFTPAQVNQLVTSPAVLADAAKALQSNGQGDWAALLQSGAFSSQVLRNTTYVQVTVKTHDPQAAQAVAQALLKASLINSHVTGEAKAKIEAELQKDQISLDQARTMETRLSQNLNGKDGMPDLKLLQTYQSWIGTVGSIVGRIEANQNRLLGLEDADVLAQPSLASWPTSPKLKPVLAISVLATGFVLLLFVFIRQAVRNASNNPESAAKLARIRQALGWRASKA
jgi:uncharacterized protein involved in exopolysaccharide biosynthesis